MNILVQRLAIIALISGGAVAAPPEASATTVISKEKAREIGLDLSRGSKRAKTDAEEPSQGPVVMFWIFGSLTVLGALLTVTRRNPVSAALFLVLTLIFTAGIYLVMNATFLAAIQVLVYAGAVMVLFLFVVMSVARYDAPEFGVFRDMLRRWPAKLVAIGTMTLLFWMPLMRVFRAAEFADAPEIGPDFGTVQSIGKLLFSDFIFPFEAISILLLVAIVGSMMVSRKPEGDS